MSDSGALVVAATPIGNPGDASPRLRSVLAAADVVAAEDTRRLRRLASTLGIELGGRLVSNFEANETSRIEALLAALRDGARVVLVSDAGSPLVSDPGYPLVRAALAAGISVDVVPGPSAVIAALAVCGLPSERWCFEGFLPRRAAARQAQLSSLAAEARTMVFFEAPHRLALALTDMAKVFGPERAAAVCRELTKIHQEVRRDRLDRLAAWATESRPRGEITIVLAGAEQRVDPVAEPVLAAEVAALRRTGATTRAAVDQVAARHGLARRIVYSAVNGSRSVTGSS
ncbi:MAG: 16S rRNA (cytidine(1402)-2'-O)-methyltransferase [Mycobacteriales bacterium]